MRLMIFAGRTLKEILRDPLSVSFGLGFPLVLLALLSMIGANAPMSLFEIEQLAPGVIVFGQSFITLFAAILVAKDRSTAFLQRLFTTPLKAYEYMLGYMLPMLPVALLQALICVIAAVLMGLPVSIEIIGIVLGVLPSSIFYIAFGFLCGTILSDKQVGGVCGALLTNVSAWLSGIWFDPAMVGGAFGKAAEMLPFLHAVEWERALAAGNYEAAFSHIGWVLAYAAVTVVAAVLVFMKKMQKNL